MSADRRRQWDRALWGCQGLLVASYELTGLLKACVPAADLQDPLGLAAAAPAAILPLVGGLEVLGALLLLLPSTLRLWPALSPAASAALAAAALLGAALPATGAGLALPLPNLALAAAGAFVCWGRLARAPIEPFRLESELRPGEQTVEEPEPRPRRPAPRRPEAVRPWATA